MKKNILFLLTLLTYTGIISAAEQLTVADINITQGGQATLSINFKFEKADLYAAYQFQLALPAGIKAVTDSNGDLLVTAGTGHHSSQVPMTNYDSESGKWIIACFSTTGNTLKGMNGLLLSINVQADAALSGGQQLSGSLTDIRLATSDNKSVKLADTSFDITVTPPADNRITLDEASTAVPKAASNAKIRMLRTIKGGEWNTIVLPFSMSVEQLGSTFGKDVELADFTGYDLVYQNDEITDINVRFKMETDGLKANHPYIIRPTHNITEFTLDDVDIDPVEQPVVEAGTKQQRKNFVGSYLAETIVPEDALFINDGLFWYSDGKTVMKAYRAYFDFQDVLPSGNSNHVKMVFGEPEPTGIAIVDITTASDEHYYNMQGQRVSRPSKGVFIKDNQKIIRGE